LTLRHLIPRIRDEFLHVQAKLTSLRCRTSYSRPPIKQLKKATRSYQGRGIRAFGSQLDAIRSNHWSFLHRPQICSVSLAILHREAYRPNFSLQPRNYIRSTPSMFRLPYNFFDSNKPHHHHSNSPIPHPKCRNFPQIPFVGCAYQQPAIVPTKHDLPRSSAARTVPTPSRNSSPSRTDLPT
jgi:hypothetical protein